MADIEKKTGLKEGVKLELEKRAEEIRNEIAIRKRKDKDFRLTSGIYYNIKDKDGNILAYRPNKYQLILQKKQHTRNIICKARQLGFSTEIEIEALDYALTHPNSSVGIIAQDKDTAQDIFRDKLKVAWDGLPKKIKDRFRVNAESVRALEIEHLDENGKSLGKSMISVSTSFRGGTLQFLHVSEFGKICAKYPDKAREIVTGAMNALGINGKLFIESTAEGNEGYFYRFFVKAWEQLEAGDEISRLDLMPFFFSRWENDAYTMDEGKVTITREDMNYFKAIEERCHMKLTLGQKKWYVKMKETQQDDMGREYPSFWEEAFDLAVEGAYYERQIAEMRRQNRIGEFPHNPNLPIYCVRDLGGFNSSGNGDDMTLIFYQKNGPWIDIIDYEEGSGYSIGEFQSIFVDIKKYNIVEDWFPHDGKKTESNGKSVSDNARKLGIPVRQLPIGSINDGINEAKRQFYRVRIDEEKCARLIKILSNYKRKWNKQKGCFDDKPDHNWASHGADAFRYLWMTFKELKENRGPKKRKQDVKTKRDPTTGEEMQVH